MKQSERYILSIFLLVLAASALILACDDSDAEKVAAAIEDRLTDALEFDNGEKIPGDPPPENEGTDYPQIAGLSAPSMLTEGSEFSIAITPDQLASLDIAAVMVYVDGAEAYIEVAAALNELTGTVQITGKLNEMPQIGGEFEIYLALLNSGGESGERKLWELLVPENDEVDGDLDFGDFNLFTCTIPGYDCSDDDMQTYFLASQAGSTCSQNCNGSADPTCYACCIESTFINMGESVFVECQACLADQGDSAASRQEAQDSWNDLEEASADCLN